MSVDLAHALLLELAQQQAAVSVPRLGKRLGQGASSIMRSLTLLGDATLGTQAGPGWVRLELQDERWMASLTEAGRAHAAQLQHR